MKKKTATKSPTTGKLVMSVKVVALSFKFTAIISAIASFALFISIAYTSLSSPNFLTGTTAEVLAKLMPIFATGFGAFALERISSSLERLEQEGLFSAITMFTFIILIGIYGSILSGVMSFFVVPVAVLLALALVILVLNKDRFKKDGSNSLVYYTLITSVLAFLAAFFPVK
jgi:hypothetical protein